MKQLLYILVFICCLNSCKTRQPIITTNIKKTDSTSTKVTYQKQLDTFKVAADSLKIIVPIADLSDKPILAKSKSGRTTGSVRKIKNAIEVECFTEEYEKIIESQNKIIETLIKLTETKDTHETVIEYQTPWYAKALSTLGVVLIVFVGAKLFLKTKIPL